MKNMSAHSLEEALARFKLITGSGSEAEGTACAMTALAWMREGAWTDEIPCVHPIIRKNVIAANDAEDSTHELRADLVRAGEDGVLDTWWIPTEVVVWALAQADREASLYERVLNAIRLIAMWKRAKERPNLADVYLERANLERANLAGADLADVYLAGAYLERANLKRANLADADLADVYLADANLKRANLADANLAGAYLERANLKRANLERASLAGASLAGASLAGASLAGANLADANLERAYLERANLADANLERANLERANLKRANLADVYLADANLKRAYRPVDPPAGWSADGNGFLVPDKEV